MVHKIKWNNSSHKLLKIWLKNVLSSNVQTFKCGLFQYNNHSYRWQNQQTNPQMISETTKTVDAKVCVLMWWGLIVNQKTGTLLKMYIRLTQKRYCHETWPGHVWSVMYDITTHHRIQPGCQRIVLAHEAIDCLPWPAVTSHDLNSIEHVWVHIKY